MAKLVRLQDSTGRGPWRPGFSKVWMADDGPDLGLPVYQDFPDFYKIVNKAHRKGKHIGCAVREDKVDLWFTHGELEKLVSLGFGFVDCSKCEVMAENDRQAIIAFYLPLKFLPKWEQK